MIRRSNVPDTMGRQTLGAKPSPNEEWCSVHDRAGFQDVLTVKVNIDGVWSYICEEDWEFLDDCVRKTFAKMKEEQT